MLGALPFESGVLHLHAGPSYSLGNEADLECGGVLRIRIDPSEAVEVPCDLDAARGVAGQPTASACRTRR